MKVILIEDRIDRMERLQSDDITKISEVNIVTGVEFDRNLNLLEKNMTRFLDDYACIAAHKTPFSDVAIDNLKDYCEQHKKALVFFSGGISYGHYKDNKFPFLNINSIDFYSSNFKLFCDDMKETNEPNLLILQFGQRWKASLLMEFRNKITIIISREELVKNNIDKLYNDNELKKEKRLSKLKTHKVLTQDLISLDQRLVFLNKHELLQLISDKQIKLLKQTIDKLIYRTI